MSEINSSSNNLILFDTATPIRLPKITELSEKELAEINLSQEDDFEMFWSDTDMSFKEKKIEDQENVCKKEVAKEDGGEKSKQKRRKRLMKYNSDEKMEIPAKKDKLIKSVAGNQEKMSMLLNPKKIRNMK